MNKQMKSFTLLPFCLLLLNNIAAAAFSTARDTIATGRPISDGKNETIVSADETFALGFFGLGTSRNRYVGIWYNKVPNTTVVWVANRDRPLTDFSGVLKINDTGTIVLLDHNNSVIWFSSNTTRAAQFPVAKLLNTGNFVVQENSSKEQGNFLWQSFDHPYDTLLPEQKIGRNLKTGLNRIFTSWNGDDDPSPGRYTFQIEIEGYQQAVLRGDGTKIARLGSWDGIQFSGAHQYKQNSIFNFSSFSNEEEIYYSYKVIDKSHIYRTVLAPDGIAHVKIWIDEKTGWINVASFPSDDCDYYATCGAFASCNANKFPECTCLPGFVRNTTDSSGSSDCVRRSPLSCQGDGFWKISGLKLPDTEGTRFNKSLSLEDCRTSCIKNCNCTAYTALDIKKGGCLLWFGNIRDMKEITESSEDIYIRLAATEIAFLSKAIEKTKSRKSNIRKKKTIIISCVLPLGALIPCSAFIIYKWKTRQKGRKVKGDPKRKASAMNDHHEGDLELPLFDMSTITFATNNFSINNILGKGGFGSVYKGILEDGREIAIKRLSKNSSQGLQEFKNEVMHVVKLQHKNLVRLLGCCIQAEERLLIYEFMPNKSLDFFIFDEKKAMLLDWPRRLHIINGIARGLLYLHQDSRHKIVHRDVKAANILLDDKMNPKISDFGLARSFGENQSKANTQHVAGTYGYLSPEYVIDGDYSTKSDVFSFGVLVSEIVSGKRNRGFYHQDHHFNLLGHAWRLFTEGKGSEIVYTTERDTSNLFAMLRSIHVGLLCVQRSPDDRPSMSSVVLMLSSESPLPQPKTPGFFIERETAGDHSSSSNSKPGSNNDVSISQLEAR